MVELKLKSCVRKKKYRSYKVEVDRVAPNILKRQFDVRSPTHYHQRSATLLLRLKRFDQNLQVGPWNNRFHLREEHRLTGLLSYLEQKSHLGQAQLPHRFHPFNTTYENAVIL